MMKTILAILIAFIPLTVMGQEYDQIEYENISKDNVVFRTSSEWASVVIQTKSDYALRFSSNVDLKFVEMDNPAENEIRKNVSAVLYSTVDDAGTLLYKIRFRTNKKYANRVLTVTSVKHHSLVDIPLFNLEKKHEYRYRIYNAVNVEDVTCYKEHVLKGNTYFDSFKYAAAREEYNLAMLCDEATAEDKKQAKQNADKCDSILYYIEQGNNMARTGKYESAADLFLKAYDYNNSDSYLNSRYEYCWRKMQNLCSFYLAEAERSYKDKDYETARSLYKEVLDNNCITLEPVLKRYEDCTALLRKSSNYERYFGLEAGGNLWGFTTGSYKYKVGSFFKLTTNGAVFELIRKNYQISDTPTLDVSFGLTIPLVPEKVIKKIPSDIFKGVWLNVEFGVMGLSRYQINHEGHEDTSEVDVLHDGDELKPKFGSCVGGGIGLTLKVWHVALRGTCCLRYPIANAKKDLDVSNRQYFSFGVGWCW